MTVLALPCPSQSDEGQSRHRRAQGTLKDSAAGQPPPPRGQRCVGLSVVLTLNA